MSEAPPEVDLGAMLAKISQAHGLAGVAAVRDLMFALGSDASIAWGDGTWLPCDFVFQAAVAIAGARS